MITTATIAASIERARDTALPGKAHVVEAEAWHAVTRQLPNVRKLPERRVMIHDRRRRAAISVRLPVRRG